MMWPRTHVTNVIINTLNGRYEYEHTYILYTFWLRWILWTKLVVDITEMHTMWILELLSGSSWTYISPVSLQQRHLLTCYWCLESCLHPEVWAWRRGRRTRKALLAVPPDTRPLETCTSSSWSWTTPYRRRVRLSCRIRLKASSAA